MMYIIIIGLLRIVKGMVMNMPDGTDSLKT